MPFAPVKLADGTTTWFSFPFGMSRGDVMTLMYESGVEIASRGIGEFQDEQPSDIFNFFQIGGGHEARPPSPPGDIEAQMPYGGFTAGLRQAGVPTTGALGQLARSQYQPAQLGFTAGQALGIVPPATTATQFAGQGAGGFRRTSAEAFRRLGEMAAGTLAPPETGQAFAQGMLDPAFFGGPGDAPSEFRMTGPALDAIQLARAQASTRLSPLTVSRFGPSNARVVQQLQNAIYGAEQGGTDFQFIPFLQQQFGR